MYWKIDDFLADWKYESEATLKMFSAVSDSTLEQKVNGYDRTLGTLAWHITTSVIQMGQKIGFDLSKIDIHSETPKTIKEISDTYKSVAENLFRKIKEQWTDVDLISERDMFGEMWKNGNTLSIIVVHQVHHRAQMTVLMRILGLDVSGIYGPSKEEWTKMGMKPQK